MVGLQIGQKRKWGQLLEKGKEVGKRLERHLELKSRCENEGVSELEEPELVV